MRGSASKYVEEEMRDGNEAVVVTQKRETMEGGKMCYQPVNPESQRACLPMNWSWRSPWLCSTALLRETGPHRRWCLLTVIHRMGMRC